MITREIKHNTDDYVASLRLRSDILRAPLGKELVNSDTDGEEHQLHFGCFTAGQLKGCIVAKPLNGGTKVKLRQMAVAGDCQGQGIGKRLIVDFERFLKNKGIKRTELSARQTAILFYKKLGYETIGGSYLEQGIEHTKMQKTL
jgi:predicted GNAT family N-acyltransferase